MKKFIQDFTVVNKFFLNPDHFILELKSPFPLPEMMPGQFAQFLVNRGKNVFLRRPFSLHDVDYKKRSIQFLIRITGRGTLALSLLEKNDVVNLIYPLGRYFTFPLSGEVLLVGGGCGMAPLLFLARKLKEKDFKQTILLGARSRNDVLETEKFSQFGTLLITTDDGTLGEKGFITQHSIWNDLRKFSRIYCCGPEPMMKAVARGALAQGIDCEVSLENLMACGIGACLCCVTETVRGNECVCTEGPVFNIKDLKWLI